MVNKNERTPAPVTRSKFDRASSWVFSKLKSSFIGRFFSSYDEMNKRFESKIRGKRKSNTMTKKRFEAKRRIARIFERSFFVNKIPVLMNHLLRTSLRDYGIAMFTMGFIMFIMYPVQSFISVLTVPFSTLVMGIILCVCSVPLMFSSRSFASCALDCTPLRAVLFSWLGIKKDGFRGAKEQPTHSAPNVSLIVGVLLGILSHIMGPKSVIMILVISILAYMVLSTPETGLVLLLFFLPFLAITHLIIITLYVDICFIIKYLIGKRTFKFELYDIFVVAIFVLFAYGYGISTDIRTAHMSVLTNMALALCYFAVANLIRSKDQYKRCIAALTISVALTSVVGILQFTFGKLGITWQGIEAFSNIKERISSSFYDADVFALYICMSVPFILLLISSATRIHHRLFGIFTLIITLICIAMAQSKPALIAVGVEILLFLLIYNRNFIYLILAIGATIPILYYSLPSNMLEALIEFGSASMVIGDARSDMLSLTGKIFLSRPYGIGIGEENLSAALKELDISANGITNLGNLYSQMLASFGILGIIILVSLAVMYLILALSFCVKAKNKHRRVNGVAGFVSFVGILIAGIYCYSLKSPELVFITFITMGLTFSYCKIERELNKPEKIYVDISSASVDIAIPAELIKNSTPKRKYVRAPYKKSKTAPKKNPLEELMNSNEFIRVVDDRMEDTSNDRP
ncbi:MAG: O-antigen ligase family protein [Clostridia bacterium]|nr:O-antigen ligase family protein [Clostridia bacterium]